jgi:hypothetical protein
MSKTFSSCSSELSENSLYYNSAESCNYSGYSHDYHCAKCSKPRAFDESKTAASFRVNDRLKLVNAEKRKMEEFDNERLDREFKSRFGAPGKTIQRDEKIVRLVSSFARANRPGIKYRLAIKLYDYATEEWKRYDTPLNPEIEHAVTKIKSNLYNQQNPTLLTELEWTLTHHLETRATKLEAAFDLASIKTGLLTERARSFHQKCCEMCLKYLFNDEPRGALSALALERRTRLEMAIVDESLVQINP